MAFIESGKERSFLVFRGANDKLSLDEIERATNLIKRAKYVYFSGYSLVNDPQRSSILKAAEIAKRFKTKVIFDPGVYNLVKYNRQLCTRLLDFCDVFSPNLDEAIAITNNRNIGGVINKLRGKIPLTALKLGEGGCILVTDERILKVQSANVKCLDPTGAGDAFAAALIYGLTHELPLEATGKLANWFAAHVTTRIGSRGFPTKSKISEFLRRLVNNCVRTETSRTRLREKVDKSV